MYKNIIWIDKYREGITSEEKINAYTKFFLLILLCVVQMLCQRMESLITLMGSRVASVIYGPKQAILVTGINKTVKDIEEAGKGVEATLIRLMLKDYVKRLDALL